MAYVNTLTREINVKIAWLAPRDGLGGLRALYDALASEARGDWQPMALPSGEVVVLDFTPLGAQIRGNRLRVHVIGGAVEADDDLLVLAKGADAVVLVDQPDALLDRLGPAATEVPVVRGAVQGSPFELVKAATRAILEGLRAGPPDPSPPDPSPPDPSPANDPRVVRVGAWPFLLPPWCADATVFDRPPLHRLDGVHVNGVSLTVAVIADMGTPAELERSLDESAAFLVAPAEPIAKTIEGVHFVGFRGRPSRGEAERMDIHYAIGGPDLLHYNVAWSPGVADAAAIDRLFTAMIAGAIVRRIEESPALFRRQ